MAANSWGSRFVVTSFGESHGKALGVVIDGMPAGVPFDEALLKQDLERRRPGGSLVSSRQEADEPEVLSGVFEGKTLGTPLAILVRNQDARSQDYQDLPTRRGHSDDVWEAKFRHRDFRGGGRASGRETVSRVMAGAVAKMLLRSVAPELKIIGFTTQIGPLVLSSDELLRAHDLEVDTFSARFPSIHQSESVVRLLEQAKAHGKSYGGTATLRVFHSPLGLGQPVFHKLKADLASAFLGIGATSAVEIGEGQEATTSEGTEFHSRENPPYGGIRGGISTGEPMEFHISFKPTSSIQDVAKKGRHDPCIVPRAIPVLEAMTALVLADHFLWSTTDRLDRVSRQSGR